MTVTAEGIRIGLLTFSFYGLLVVLAAILSMVLLYRRAKVRKLETAQILPIAFMALIGAILGARTWHAFFPSPGAVRAGITAEFYRRSLLDFFAFWQGGFSLPGAILGGFFGFTFSLRRQKLKLEKWLRAAFPMIPFAIAIIIWGNYFTQENYGLPTALPWAIAIEPQYRIPALLAVETYHPLFLYQSLWALLTTVIVIACEKRTHHDRWTVPLTGMLLSAGFFLLEFVRVEAGAMRTAALIFWGVFFSISLLAAIRQWQQQKMAKL